MHLWEIIEFALPWHGTNTASLYFKQLMSYPLGACGGSLSTMQTVWQSGSCRARGCPPDAASEGRAEIPRPWRPALWDHSSPAPAPSKKSTLWKHPCPPCLGKGCFPVAVWWDSWTPQMFLRRFPSGCCFPGPRRLILRRWSGSLVPAGRGSYSSGPGRPDRCRGPRSRKGSRESSCWRAGDGERPEGWNLGLWLDLGRCSPPCGDLDTNSWMDSCGLA